MDKLHINLKPFALAGVALCGLSFAAAQTGSYANEIAKKSGRLENSVVMFESGKARSEWTIALIASAAVAVTGVGVKDDNLAFVGFGCVLVSGAEVLQNGFRMNFFDRGLDLARSGHLSFGIDPIGHLIDSARSGNNQPGVYLKASFRF